MRWALAVVSLLGSATTLLAEDSGEYLTKVKPVLQSRCYSCHGALKQESGLRLDTALFAIQGGDSGRAVVAGQPSSSLLIQRVTATEESERMPPEGEPLKPEEIATLRAWIEAGAASPAEETPERNPRDHWAFQQPRRPPVPRAIWANSQPAAALPQTTTFDPHRDSAMQNPIDAFLAAEQQKRNLRPQPAADRRVWLRRVTLDLIGLPPTPEELAAFVADNSADAVDKVVTRLLDSPHYGERWGRHWMDIWRYSDWWGLGEDARNSMKHIWHWRDWIVESLNADQGYDQMLLEMLAADELFPEDQNRLRAGGFLSRQYFKFNRTSWLDETIEHTAKSMLGLTFNCAKCHDHKYDPFSQADYYRFRAIFEPYQVRLDAIDGQLDFEKDGIPRPFDCNLEAKTFLHIRGDDRNPDTSREMEPAVPTFLSQEPITIAPVSLPPLAVQPGLRPEVVESYLKQAQQRILEKQTELQAARSRLVQAEQRAIEEASLSLEERQRNQGENMLRESFSQANPNVWDAREGQWDYTDGKLVQSLDGTTRGTLRLRLLPPDDFEAKFKFVITSGQIWKSVGITFDGTDSNELLAYLSAYAEGSKAQVAYKKGDYLYPPEATRPRPILLNTPYELTLRVRGTLINLLVNGEQTIAYRSPLPRQRGVLQLITYDAQAEFHSFELNSLSPETMLVEATTGSRPVDSLLPVDQSKLAVVIAEKGVAWAMTQPDAIRARARADEARFLRPATEDAATLAKAAARAERIVAAAKADEEIARAELDVMRAAADKKAELESKLTAARTAHAEAVKAIDEQSETFQSLRGASKALESNLETEDSRLKPFPATSTGRRTALARWMTDPRNPLTARVAVNHIWSRHFGRPLVPTVFDFGRKGATPTHPELLDWLAVELMEGDSSPPDQSTTTLAPRAGKWSMKHIHRLIVTSNAYRMSSTSAGAAAECLTNDPDNRFYWRMNPIRMESQIVRDALLSLAGELDLTMGGPSIPTSNETSRRRSLYFVHSNIDHQKFLSMFDDASVLDCYRRAESIVPQQALALENSPLATEMAQKITQRILKSHPSTQAGSDISHKEFIRQAFLLVLNVEPTETEQTTVAEAMSKMTAAAKRANRAEPETNARIGVVQALLNHNDFVTVR